MMLSGCTGLGAGTSGIDASQQANAAPICLGRFVITLPEGAEPIAQASYQSIEIEDIKAVSGFPNVARQLEARAKKMRTAKMENSDYTNKLYRAAGYDPDVLFGKTQFAGIRVDRSQKQAMIGYHPELDVPTLRVELHKVIDDAQYVLATKGGSADDYDNISAFMWKAAERFRHRAADEIPNEPGFCMDKGLFADDGDPPVSETFSLFVRFKDHPDATFSIDSFATGAAGNEDELEIKSRFSGALGLMMRMFANIHVMDRGNREAAGQKGYQVALSTPSEDAPGATMYKFSWAAKGVLNDATRPYMEIELDIQPDDDKPATITSGKEAEALWNRLLNGIRIRPNSVIQQQS